MLVTGIADEHSIAWGCAKAFHAMGARLAVTYRNEHDRAATWPTLVTSCATIKWCLASTTVCTL